ncbi:MAG TPA: glutathione S-transferase family protein [Woeseiaceae bacterium]|nr:glutathione S-transferase family protein [Woeseiaceae bacterium]
MYTLYYSPGTASIAVHLVLLELGVPYQLELVDFDRKLQRSEPYLRLNPLGQVPTLLIDGQPYAESAALLMMLADRHPEARLAPPPGTARRNEWYQWLVFQSNVLGASFRNWFYPSDLGSAEHLPAVKAALQSRVEGAWERLEKHLAGHGPYLLGDELSTADLQLIMYMRWSRNMPRSALDWPALKQFAKLLRERNSWKQLCDIEKLDDWRE